MTVSYSKETALYNEGAIAGDLASASRTATNYITSVENDGVWVTPSDAKPVDGAAVSTTRGWHIAEALEYFIGVVRYIKAWVNGSNSVPTVRLGQDSAGHTDVTPNGMEVFTDASTSVAYFGDETRIGNGASYNVDIDDISVSFNYGDTTKAYIGYEVFYTRQFSYPNELTLSEVKTSRFGFHNKRSGPNVFSTVGRMGFQADSGFVFSYNPDYELDADEPESEYFITLKTRKNTTSVAAYFDYNGSFHGGIAGNFAQTSHVIVDATEVAAGGYLSGNLSIAKSGYTPISVAGQTSDQRYVSFIRAYISDATDGSGTLHWMVYNSTTSAKTPTMRVYVLWAKS